MDTTPATETTDTSTAEPTTTAARIAAIPALLRARVDELQVRARELGERAKVLQARAKDLPTEARTRALALVSRIRIALDLPSRSEIAELTARLDQLDQRIAALSGGASAPIASLPDATPEPVAAEGTGAAEVPEQSRKDKKRNEAAKKSRR